MESEWREGEFEDDAKRGERGRVSRTKMNELGLHLG